MGKKQAEWRERLVTAITPHQVELMIYLRNLHKQLIVIAVSLAERFASRHDSVKASDHDEAGSFI
jgi:hypothetical protein